MELFEYGRTMGSGLKAVELRGANVDGEVYRRSSRTEQQVSWIRSINGAGENRIEHAIKWIFLRGWGKCFQVVRCRRPRRKLLPEDRRAIRSAHE